MEGADSLIPIGIEDKYEVISILHETAATAVLLVNYKQIGALRILKAIHRAHPNAHSILSEAHLLQGIKSSQIPTIYSVEDTDEMYYLVEEFIEGISLREYLLETKLTKAELLRLSISLCDVVYALHNATPEPVLYRDMKPEHIILQGEKLRLIDFGISIRKSEAARVMPLGTVSWAAPEQLKGHSLDERCDIYSVGKIIEFMQINSYAKDDFRLKKLVAQATAFTVDKRLKSIDELRSRLLELQGVRVNEKSDKGYLGKKIAVIGADDGIGTSHIAINLCRYLNKRKINAYYKDVENNTVHHLWNNLNKPTVKEGVLYHDSFRGILNYGDAVKSYSPPDGLYILDCGTNDMHIKDAWLVLYVTTSSPFKNHHLPKWVKDSSVYIISNFSNKLGTIALAKAIGKKVYRYPLVPWSIKLSQDEERIFSTILKHEKDFNI
ncbi:MAG: protein kinase [Pseudobutyrivibrio sp.]|nr:protein kinase [Pseudobutyrivibrio sp.]